MPTAGQCSTLLTRLAAAALAAHLATAPALAQEPATAFRDATDERLPPQDPTSFSMDVATGDVDGNGAPDLLIAVEFRPNILLRNRGDGTFEVADGALPAANHDSEDVAFADFDGDDDLDAVSVSEDDRLNELYLNDGSGVFADVSTLLPVAGTSNAVAVADIDGDDDTDILIGNNGRNVLLLNDGGAVFTDASAGRLPQVVDITQDIKLGDIDGDGDLDIAVANETDNALLVNLGDATFRDESAARLPAGAPQETRDVELVDVDGDDDLDLFYANVRLFQQGDPQNRLLINDGTGVFADETAERLPPDQASTMDGAFVDLDTDGDLDLVLANFGDISGRTARTFYRALINDGSGNFRDATAEVLPLTARGNGMHVEPGDFDGDGRIELYLASRGGIDHLLVPASP